MIGSGPVKDSRSRRLIAINDPAAVRRWSKHLKVTKDELQCAIDKVGNSVTAVRKQIGIAK
jgi:Protein of unknown function (DUF3606)